VVGRIRFALERSDSPRRSSHVAQLFSLATMHAMSKNKTSLLLALLAIVPAIMGLIVLGLAALFFYFTVHTSVWVLAVVGICFVGCAFFMFRCSYLNLRRPTPATVREACDWLCMAVIANAWLSKSWFAFILCAIVILFVISLRSLIVRKIFEI